MPQLDLTVSVLPQRTQVGIVGSKGFVRTGAGDSSGKVVSLLKVSKALSRTSFESVAASLITTGSDII